MEIPQNVAVVLARKFRSAASGNRSGVRPSSAQHCPQISCIANRSDDAARWGFREENAWPVGRDGRTPLVQKLRRRHISTCFGVNWLLEFAGCAYLWAMLSVLGRSNLRSTKSCRKV